jgi:CelD/BcsL family acetyltransferase involved in cellulose biosynthesis
VNSIALANNFAEQWSALCRHAVPNVFISPTALEAVQVAGFSRTKLLPAWLGGQASGRLIGLWALQQSSLTPMGPAFLSAPPYNYAFLSNPVLDEEYLDLAMNIILDAIELDDHLPKVLRLRYLDADCPSYAALTRALRGRGAKMMLVSRHERPVITKEGALLKASGATRKKLRQKWRRLCAMGVVEVLNDSSVLGVQKAFEVFLKMEHASWKGSAGTSLLSEARDAAFARKLIAELSQDASASVALLTLDRRPIAAQVLLQCCKVAYTWKTAFNADFSAVSPGALLVEKISEQLFGSGSTELIESCSPEGSFINQLWPERRFTVEVVVHLGLRKSIDYTAVAISARSYEKLREIRNKLRETKRLLLNGRVGSNASKL